MRVLVTGAHGFVGSNVVRTLAQAGHEVLAVGRRRPDDWLNRFWDGVPDITHVVADLGIAGNLAEALAGERLDAVVHAAVVTATTLQVEKDDAARIVHVNAGGTVEALEAAKSAGAVRFVYVSSPSAIGEGDPDVATDETVQKHPRSLYGITKDASEEIVRRFAELHELSAASVRIAQPYGPGERATPSRVRTSPIYEWICDAEADRTLPTGPLSRSRDWTFIDDTACGITTLATAAELTHDLYHLAHSHAVSVGEVVDELRRAYPKLSTDEKPSPDKLNPNIAGAGGRRPLDTTRFRNEFGWAPSIGIAEGLQRYLAWWRDFHGRAS